MSCYGASNWSCGTTYQPPVYNNCSSYCPPQTCSEPVDCGYNRCGTDSYSSGGWCGTNYTVDYGAPDYGYAPPPPYQGGGYDPGYGSGYNMGEQDMMGQLMSMIQMMMGSGGNGYNPLSAWGF